MFIIPRLVLNIADIWFDMQPSIKYPDFKHKENGTPLWIGSQTPKWAIDALPPAKPSKAPFKQETFLS